MKKILTTITTILSLHLWYSNADLLIAAKELAVGVENVSNFNVVCLTLFALSYSILTAVSVVKMQKYMFVALFAILDGFAVYLRINVNQQYFLIITSIFFAVYTAYIISVCWLLNHQQTEKENQEKSSPNFLGTQTQPALPIWSEAEKKLLTSCKRRISGSGKSPQMIAKVIEECPDNLVKKELEKLYM